MEQHPVVSTITVNYNHQYFPKLCLEAVKKSVCEGEIEVIFVDNASTDPVSLNFLRQAAQNKEIILIESLQNLGFAGGNNLGAKSAHGEFILILNPDTQVTPHAIQKMVNYLRSNPDVGILGPKLSYSDGAIQESCRRDMHFVDLIVKRTFLKHIPYFRKRERRYLMEDFDHSQTQSVDLITGACMMLTRKLYEEISGFDDRYFLFMEDFDLCRKVRSLGLKVVYYPEAVVHHHHKRLSGGSFWQLLRKKVFWIHVVSAYKYFLKWRKPMTNGVSSRPAEDKISG